MSIFFEILVRRASYGLKIDQSHGENWISHIITNVNSYQSSCKQCCPIAVYAMCYSLNNPCGCWTLGTLFALVSNRNTLYNVMGVKTHLSVNLPQSVSISGAEINLTLRAVTTYVLCCNLAPSMSALKMCIFSNIVMKWQDYCCGLGHTV